MSRTFRLLMLAALLLPACTAQTVYEPVPVSSELLVYVPVPEELTEKRPIAEGPLRDCPAVAKARKTELLACNAQLEQVRGIQGTPQRSLDEFELPGRLPLQRPESDSGAAGRLEESGE